MNLTRTILPIRQTSGDQQGNEERTDADTGRQFHEGGFGGGEDAEELYTQWRGIVPKGSVDAGSARVGHDSHNDPRKASGCHAVNERTCRTLALARRASVDLNRFLSRHALSGP